MAFSNTYNTTSPGSAALNREDLSEVMTMLAHDQTPIVSLASKVSAKAMRHDWGVDAYAAPVTTARLEGTAYNTGVNKDSSRTRLYNYCHSLKRAWEVSYEQEAVDGVGGSAIARAKAKTAFEIKRDLEATVCGTQDFVAGDGTNASTMRGLGRWIGSTDADIPAAFRTPSTSSHTSGALTETIFNNLITSMYRASGKPADMTLVADTGLRRAISNFSRSEGSVTAKSYYLTQGAAERKISFGVSFYQSDHGMISIVNANPECMPVGADGAGNYEVGYFIDPEMLQIAELISLKNEDLPNNGASTSGVLLWTGTLVVKSPLGLGKITDVDV